MQKSCRYCGGAHSIGDTCPKAPPKWRRSSKYHRNESKAARFRSTNAWTQKAERIKIRDLYLCKVCLKESIITNRSLSVHHVIPLREDFDRRLDDDNLITLCERHHRMAERGEIPRIELLRLVSLVGDTPRGKTAENI